MADKIRQIAAAAAAYATGSKNKYFTSAKKGENFELKAELNSDRKDIRKDAVKKVIANMTVGKDVAPLFADVLKCIQTDDIELKKLVYLYLMNYAKTQPEIVILAVNTFCKDTEDTNPLIRALAIRTMGCLRVEKIIDYLIEPLRKTLKDNHPYVRKTAVLCVAKLYDLDPVLAEEHGFISILQAMLTDSNPIVVSNVVAALAEIHNSCPSMHALTITPLILHKLLSAMNECTEWGVIFILDALSEYNAHDSNERDLIVEKAIPYLQHANESVVMSAFRVMMVNYDKIKANAHSGHTDEELLKVISKKISPPLVSLMNSFPEIQYLTIRNIKFLIQKIPELLENEVALFFCKYDDPLYVKIEKLDMLAMLTDERMNADKVLVELKAYATEVDFVFARKSIQTLCKLAIGEKSTLGLADKVVEVLIDLIKAKLDFQLQQSIIAFKDILRKWPHSYDHLLSIITDCSPLVDDPIAKASLLWMLGEYPNKIPNSAIILNKFFSNQFVEDFVSPREFEDEEDCVQLSYISAAVKLYLSLADEESHSLVQRILAKASGKSMNPDLRDRAIIYSRLLQSHPLEFVKKLIIGEKKPILLEVERYDSNLLLSLIANIGTVSSIIHKFPQEFTPTISTGSNKEEGASTELDGGICVKSSDSDISLNATTSNPVHLIDLQDLDFGVESSPTNVVHLTDLNTEQSKNYKEINLLDF